MSSPPDPAAKPEKFYLTTPIYYVNARPHIGHAYTTIVADVLARRHRLLGEDTFFLTGTDEHGQKIERSAQAKGMPPQQFADEVAASFENLWKRMGITNNRFIRTTDPRHIRGAQQLFTALYEGGFIYLASYTGAYCVSDEAFVDVPVGAPCPDCGRITESVTEENFFFKLSAFQRPLLDLIEPAPNGEPPVLKVEPETRRNEVLSFLRGDTGKIIDEIRDRVVFERSESEELTPGRVQPGSYDRQRVDELAELDERFAKSTAGNYYVPGALKDLSISRSSFTWGVPVPEVALRHAGAKDKHVIYVWLDALANYMTAVGYGDPSPEAQEEFKKWWPADLHLVGKEIIRFHCVYWPAFLLALNPALQQVEPGAPSSPTVPSSAKVGSATTLHPDPATVPFEQHQAWAAEMLPKAITAHGWLLFDNAKMSKSKGNIVRTETILEAFGRLCPPLPVAPFGLSFRSAAEESASALALRPPTPHERDLFAADVLRYFLLREIPFGQDGSFSFEAMVTRYNADLANGYGNLVSRTLGLMNQNLRSSVPSCASAAEERVSNLNAALGDQIAYMIQKADEAYASGTQLSAMILAAPMEIVAAVDAFINDNKPWKLAKAPDDASRCRLNAVVYCAAESIRIITALLYPILPFATARVWAQLGLGDIEEAAANGELNNLQWGGLKPGTKLGPLSPIFPRADKSLIQIMTDMENEKSSTPTPNLSSRPESSPREDAVERPAGSTDDTQSGAPSSPAEPAKVGAGSTTFKAAATPTPAAPVATSTTDPAAPPRSLDSLDEPAGTLPVAGSLAEKPALPTTPGPATEAPASGAFGGTASQTSIDAQPTDASPQITIGDFAKVELRVAQVVVAERIPKADKLLRLEVDLGYEKRQILSGIAEWYTPEELLGRRIVVITNLAPRKMRGLESHGMLLAASNGEGGKPVLATFGEEIALGSRLK